MHMVKVFIPSFAFLLPGFFIIAKSAEEKLLKLLKLKVFIPHSSKANQAHEETLRHCIVSRLQCGFEIRSGL